MFFRRKDEKELSQELFKSPDAEYRAAPFWAWNSELKADELERQIGIFKEMGFGGFNMHVRQGLCDEYLGESYLNAIRHCAECAEREGMYAWLYDEDRWPSGAAGGIVTKNPAYRQKYLNMCFSDKKDCAASRLEAAKTGKPYFLAAFSVSIDEKGIMRSYKRVGRDEECEGKRYFFLEQRQGGEPRYNGQSYVDTMSREAIDAFIAVTHERLKSAVGDKFGKAIPSIFTDEPQLYGTCTPKSARHSEDIGFSWTSDFDITYRERYGSDILDSLPVLFYETDSDAAYPVRYNYYTHLSDRFSEAFVDNIGEWCDKNGIALSGHVLGEDALWETLLDNADNMRTYRKMHYPGIDMLCDDLVYNTPIQCRSVVRQYGKEAMLSEMYGVTGWDFDFRGHKFQGDWQACLGVNVRVPHLAWQSMKGEGKRDYPAPISYQSPWHLEYKLLEDHYARINTAMTRGEADPSLAVIYPIDTYKMIYSSLAESRALREEIENNYRETTEWLLSSGFDFDFISESLLPELTPEGSYPLKVGKMSYTAVLVSDCMTLRPHTLSVLEKFKENGGRVIIMGRAPEYSDALRSERAMALKNGALTVSHSKSELLKSLSGEKRLDIRLENGAPCESLMHSSRRDGASRWIFLSHMKKPELPHLSKAENIRVRLEGSYSAELYDTMTGNIMPIEYETDGKYTEFRYTLYGLDTLLVKLSPVKAPACHKRTCKREEWTLLPYTKPQSFRMHEPNVLLLDMAEYSVDGGELMPREEIMRIDSRVREMLGLPLRKFKVRQPWAVEKRTPEHSLKLVYRINSECDTEDVMLATEHPETLEVSFNGKRVSNEAFSWYVDKDIKTIPLGRFMEGENVIELSMPMGELTDVEASYLIGNFGTVIRGSEAYLTAYPESIDYGDLVPQGFAFYGGNTDYEAELELQSESDVEIKISHFRGALVGVTLDGEDIGRIFAPPFTLKKRKLSKGKHKLTFTLFGTRYNTFSALHNLNADKKRIYIGPDFWRSEGEAWSYEYNPRKLGILKAPEIRIRKTDE